MAILSASSLGEIFRICEGKFDLASPCHERLIIDVLNLIFVFIYYLSLIIAYVKRTITSSNIKKDWITIGVSSCCVLTGLAYLGIDINDLINKNDEFSQTLVGFVKAFIWITLSVSQLTQGTKWIQILTSVWWVLFFLLISIVNTKVLIDPPHKVGVFDVVPWLVSFLLLLCALRNITYLVSQHTRKHSTLLEPLIDNNSETRDNHSTLNQASFFSKLLFSWISPLLHLGRSKPLGFEDVPPLVMEDEANVGFEKFTMVWDSLARDRKFSDSSNLVIQVLSQVYFKDMMITANYILIRTASIAISPWLLYAFVNYANSNTEDRHNGSLLVGCLVLAKIIESLSHRHFFFHSRRTGMNLRSALMASVYQKQLRLSSLGRRRHSTGEIVNYIAVDAYRMGEFPMWFHMAWSSALQLVSVIAVLLCIIGIGVLPGLIPLLLSGFLNVPYAKSIQKCQSEFMIEQDRRLRSTSEILNNMKIIKLQSWEEKFKNLIESFRGSEFKWLGDYQYKKVYNTMLFWMSPTVVSSVIFFGCAILNTAPLNAETVFTILAALRIMGEPVRMIPEALSVLIQVKVSFDRLNTFLLEDELKSENMRNENDPSADSVSSIRIRSGDFSWDPESTTRTLKNLNLEARTGEKIAVCGTVGAGKSSLLYAILGEIPKISGTVDVSGSIAYVSQASWIQSGTVRDNILFGKPMDEAKYDKAISVCALDKDIRSFSHGDLTEIGQRGLNMSGGQKQRIQLARAVYNDADIYLLDDPFSAVDAHTAATLFDECVMSALEKKIVILVTHQVEFLSAVDNILVMEGGHVTQSGNYEELLMQGTTFEQLVNAHKEAIKALDNSNIVEDKSEQQQQIETIDWLEETNRSFRLMKENSQAEISTTALPGVVQLTEEEEREMGDLGLKPFLDYISVAKGWVFLLSTVLSQCGFIVLQAAASYWLAFAIQIPNITSVVLVAIYASISLTSAFFVYLRSLFTALLGLKASKAFFTGFTDSIFNAPMHFFDSTPVGRILTRASTDLSVIDFDVPFSITFVLAPVIEIIAAICVMASVTWQVIVVGTFAAVASKYVQGYYQSSAGELMRINGITKAPVMNYASETSLGVVTIRAFNTADRFFQNYLKLIDADAKVFFYSNAAMEWLILRTEALQNLTLFTVAFLLVLQPKGYVAPGLVGLSLSYALALTSTQVFLTRWFSSLANYIISVERIKQFMHIPPEPPAVVEENRPPSSWPSKGRIQFQDLKIRYRPNSPLVLKGITCSFIEGKRVGVVGRTGSGKTTLISALFRLVEPHSGRILIDGLDICSIGLKDLRMKLSIIPQEPTLFRGSVRTNLDPLGLYSDEDIWKALEKCQLKSSISKLPHLLDSSVSDEGENWSVGQRQLFCLGRVLLRRNKILVLDEATASIDSATDAMLQTIIREEFSDCTVITIAHRVPTVIDSDMVMVLSFGKVKEYDAPAKLMETSSSSFSKLVAEYWSTCRRNSSQKLTDHFS